MSQTITVTVDIAGKVDRFTLVVTDGYPYLPESCGEVARLLAARIRDGA